MATANNCNAPEELLYWVKEHVWVRPEEDGTITVGMTDAAQHLAGMVVNATLKKVGRKVKKGRGTGIVESGKWVGPIKSPVNGIIVEVNENVSANPSVLNSDPYGDGWFVRIQPADWESEKTNLVTGTQAVADYEAFLMVDIIGHEDTIRQVYHLDSTPADYEAVLARLERHDVPTVPHIILGLHYGRMLGEWQALEMIARHPPQLLVLVILMPLSGTAMAVTKPPSLAEIGGFFETSRKTRPQTPVMLGCTRPMGLVKRDIDRLAIDAGLNGIAYPADGIVEHARQRGLQPHFINACCGVTW